MEEATYLTRYVSSVTIVHRREEFRASNYMIERAKSNPKIKFMINTVVEEYIGTNVDNIKKLTHLRLRNAVTDEVTTVEADGAFVAIGHEPNTSLFKEVLDMDEVGYIETKNRSTYTNVEGVFACGDAQDSTYRQAVTAAGSGCMAAIDAERWLETTHHAQHAHV
jgi:thioredoxin reductase (NADPH)